MRHREAKAKHGAQYYQKTAGGNPPVVYYRVVVMQYSWGEKRKVLQCLNHKFEWVSSLQYFSDEKDMKDYIRDYLTKIR